MSENKSAEQIQKELAEPFLPEEIEWRVMRSGIKNEKPWALCLAYIDNRAIMNRLDNVLGIGGWQSRFVQIKDGFICELSLKIDGEWIVKSDGAQETQVEETKGGLSGSMKRAGNQGGIGRYLYDLKETFANIAEKGEYKGVVKGKGGAKDVYFRWNPPTLPKWALPEGSTSVKKEEVKEVKSEVKEPEVKTLTLQELIDKALEAKAFTHLKNIWGKYKADIATLTPEERKKLNEKKEYMKNFFDQCTKDNTTCGHSIIDGKEVGCDINYTDCIHIKKEES